MLLNCFITLMYSSRLISPSFQRYCLFVCLFVCSFVCLFVCLFVRLFVCLFDWLIDWLINWLTGMLLVSRSGLVENNAVELFHYYDVVSPGWYRPSFSLVVCLFDWLINWSIDWLFDWLFDWLIVMLLVSRSGLVEKNAVELFHHCGVQCPGWCPPFSSIYWLTDRYAAC